MARERAQRRQHACRSGDRLSGWTAPRRYRHRGGPPGHGGGVPLRSAQREPRRPAGRPAQWKALPHSAEECGVGHLAGFADPRRMRRELVDVDGLTADVVRALTAQAATTGVGLVTEVGAPSSVNADKDLLREAVANLVDNAVRVSPPGAMVRLTVDRGSAGPVIAVADTGPGIEEDRLPRLFERFQRSDSGSGLGLAIARRVVERHGGTIRVKTERGAGSTFTIELPPG